MKEAKVPKRILMLVEKCERGEALVVTHVNKRNGGTETVFTLHPSGREVGEATARQAIRDGYLKPRMDALFDCASQSYGV